MKKENTELGRPIKVSSSSQTSAGGPVAKEMEASEAEAIIQAIFDKNSTKPEKKPTKAEKSFNLPGEHDYANAAAEVVAVGLGDTQSADFLMRRLESAITGGRVEEAAELAQKLAALRLPCTVVTRHQQETKGN